MKFSKGKSFEKNLKNPGKILKKSTSVREVEFSEEFNLKGSLIKEKANLIAKLDQKMIDDNIQKIESAQKIESDKKIESIQKIEEKNKSEISSIEEKSIKGQHDVKINYDSGSFYEGSVKDKKKFGFGKYVNSKNEKYEGRNNKYFKSILKVF